MGYEPNSYGEWQEQPHVLESALAIDGMADHFKQDDDYYTQPSLLFNLMTSEQQQVLFENTARAMGDAPIEIKKRHIGNCMKADVAYGEGVAKALVFSRRAITRTEHLAGCPRVDGPTAI